MDSSKKYDNPSPEESANPISKLFFIWVLPFFKFGYSNDLEVKDLYNCVESDSSGSLGDELEKNWDDEVERAKKNDKKPKLLKAISKTFLKSYSAIGVVYFVQAIGIRLFQPIVLAEYIRYFGTTSRNPHIGWLLGVGVVLMAFINILFGHHGSLICQRIGMRCRIACCSLIYRKLLKLDRMSLGQVAVGPLVNLLSNDVQRFDVAAASLHFIWIMPIQAVLAFYIMFRSVQWAALAGFAAITLQAVPLQGYLSKLQGVYRYQIAQKTDNRIKIMNEITSGIQVIKMYAWEKPFEKVVKLARKSEILIVTKTSYIRGFTVALAVFTERATLYLTLVTYVLMGNQLTGAVVFSIAQLFNTVQLYMSIFYPMGVSAYAEGKTSISRLEDFLNLGEIEQVPMGADTKDGRIRLKSVSASWIASPIVGTLMNLTVDIRPGSLCCVVGSVGAGKTSLLQLILNELTPSAGTVDVSGSISYASQEPWLFISSVRNNILFGQKYVKERYRKVVEVCALEKDFEQFPFGDRSLVGERGASLSGGQRARINLARAVYRDADIYLFDDPLSAVDTHVGKHLFDECIRTYLYGKTRILVTHQLQFLRQADVIIVLNNGKIDKIGTYSDLSENDLNTLNANRPEQAGEKIDEEARPDEVVVKVMRDRLTSITSQISTLPETDDRGEIGETQELMEKGEISASVYWEYFKSGANFGILLLMALLFLVAQGFCNSSDIWLTLWTQHSELSIANSTNESINLLSNNTTDLSLPVNLSIPNVTGDGNEAVTSGDHSQTLYITIYSILIILSIVFMVIRSMVFFKICMKSSRNLHSVMFANILQATMRFFDTNPSGRILNRFSKDMGIVDEVLPRCMMDAIQIFLVMSGILFMVFLVTPWMITVTIVLGVLFYWMRTVYQASGQDVKRLEGITLAPMFSHVTASLNGLPTIRSSKAQKIITDEFDLLQDQYTKAWFLFVATSESFGFYLDMISAVFLMILTFQFLIFDDGSIISSRVGLVISQSLILTGMLQHGVRQSTQVASNIISVERILQYTKLDKEGPFETLPTKKTIKDWPCHGKIEFKQVYLRYNPEDEPVLKNLNILIKPGEKVGIVGRTGAGKSSLISALFRLTTIDGAILIDDIDTSDLGLTDLRSKISIIPQDPILFSASVRYNLDPFDVCDDKTLWTALQHVELKDAIESLDQRVNESGSNFSAGQRQLVCLARAIVRNNKILVLDEATANVDPTTDGLIQTTIRENFKNCTVLTIAHRLNTIMDSDKVLVMNYGQVVEFAHPHVLLRDRDGFFSKMLAETGSAMEESLKKIAKDDYEQKFPNQNSANDNKD